MSHDHDHHHHPPHTHDKSPEMSVEEKLVKLLNHWMQHNEEHAKSYEQWAERANSKGLALVGTLIEKAAEKTRTANEDFQAALDVLNP